MNVATLNQNNNATDSVVLPPQMKNILFWYDSYNHYELTSDKFSTLWDRSGRGYNMAQTTAVERPARAGLHATKFAGRQIIHFNDVEDRFGNGDDKSMAGTVNLLDCFGEIESLVDNPSWVIAYVSSVSSSTGGEDTEVVQLTSSGAEKIKITEDSGGLGNDGYFLNVESNEVDDSDYCGGTSAVVSDTPRITLVTCENNTTNSILEIRKNGTGQVWDDLGGSDTTSEVDFKTFSNIATLKLGVTNGTIWKGESWLAEVIFINAKLTAAEKTQLESYLNDKWKVY